MFSEGVIIVGGDRRQFCNAARHVIVVEIAKTIYHFLLLAKAPPHSLYALACAPESFKSQDFLILYLTVVVSLDRGPVNPQR